MRSIKKIISILLFYFVFPFPIPGFCYGKNIFLQQEIRLHYITEWQIEPSLKFDTLCFINTLTGDPFYLKDYQDEYNDFKHKLSELEKKALSNLKKNIKDKNRNIISAFFCLYFSATDDETIKEMLATLENSGLLKDNLKKSPYYSEQSWRLFESTKNDLKTVLLFLKNIGFETYWRKYIIPKARERIKKIRSDLPKYNIISEVESHLGHKLSSRRITIYLLHFSKPHALRILGTRYLLNIDWPFKIALRTAVHEMMHPPFDLVHDFSLKEAVYIFKNDKFLMDKVRNHDPALGYNTFESFFEEDCVQAIEQIINEKLEIHMDPHKRWKEADNGMHVFAVALYTVMKEEKFNKKGEAFRDFLVRMIRSGRLAPGKIKKIYDAFYDQ
jgi:hypothetical protein